MNRGVVAQILSLGVDVVRGGTESENEDETGVTDRRDPNRAHPGGYSRRDSSSWVVSCGWGNLLPYRSGDEGGRGPGPVVVDGGS